VIGGGDWAKDRIIPDTINNLTNGTPISVRNPFATRPWQHVLEPLSGYLSLASKLYLALEQQNKKSLERYCSAYNFGPEVTANRPVKELVETALTHWDGEWQDCSDGSAPHEASLLNLVWDKAYHELGWLPAWSFEEAVKKTILWYKYFHEQDGTALSLVEADIEAYSETFKAS
jgi:CDP-glucose 4,6-dehydratase